jgi:hypothetical protein
MPSCVGEWYTVQIEPIAHSGERLTALVIAIGAGELTGKYLIENTFEGLRALQNSSIAKLCDLVDSVAVAMERGIQETGVPTQEGIPFQGVFLSVATQARAESLEGILKQGIRFSSCFGLISNPHLVK